MKSRVSLESRDEYANSETVCPTTTTDNNDCKAHSSVDADKGGLLHRSRRNADRTHFQGEGLQRRAKKSYRLYFDAHFVHPYTLRERGAKNGFMLIPLPLLFFLPPPSLAEPRAVAKKICASLEETLTKEVKQKDRSGRRRKEE